MPLRKKGESGNGSCSKHLACARALVAVGLFLSSAEWLFSSGRRDFKVSFADPERHSSGHLKADLWSPAPRLSDLLQQMKL